MVNRLTELSTNTQDPQNQEDFERLTQLLDHLLETVGETESKQLLGLVNSLFQLIDSYEECP